MGVDGISEAWVPIRDYEGIYNAGSLGSIQSLPRIDCAGRRVRGRLLKQVLGKRGYYVVGLHKDGQMKLCTVHQLVAEAFLGPCPPGMEVRHGPNGPLDNRASQLCYGTKRDNAQDKFRDGTQPIGDTHHNAILTEALVAECRIRNAGMESYEALAAEFGVTPSAMGYAIAGRSWRDCETPRMISGNRCGERHQEAKLTDAIVLECRRRYTGRASALAMAAQHGVHLNTMYSAVTGRTWKHLPMP